MRKVYFILVFLFFSTINVEYKLRAETHKENKSQNQSKVQISVTDHLDFQEHQRTVESPIDCLKEKSFPCSVKNLSPVPYSLEIKDARIELSHLAILVLENEKSIRLVQGRIYFYSLDLMEIKTRFGSVETGLGVMKIEINEDRMLVASLVGEHGLRRIDGVGFTLPEATQNWTGGMTSQGNCVSGIPETVPRETTLKDWGKSFQGKGKDFILMAKQFNQSWVEKVQVVSRMQKEMAIREIANDAANKKRKAELLERRKREEAELRKLFRQKNYLDL